MSSTTTMGSKKYICKFCKRNFPCGRSLGGHIRSHMIHSNNNSSDSLIDHQSKPQKPGYGLRENPKKSNKGVRLLNSSSSSSWSNESETNPISIREGKDIGKEHSSLSEVVEPEQDEVAIAMCLIMLSRDVGEWGNVPSCEFSDDILLLQPKESSKFTIKTEKKQGKYSVFDANGVDDACKESKNMGFSGCGSLQNGSKMKRNVEDPTNGFAWNDQSNKVCDSKSGDVGNVSPLNPQCGLKLKRNNQYNKPPLSKRKIDDIDCSKKRYEITTNGGCKNWSKMMEFQVCEDDELVLNDGANNINKRSKFECSTCNKVFHSYQALGGHRASHKRLSSSDKNSIVSKLDEFAYGEDDHSTLPLPSNDQGQEQSICDIRIGSSSSTTLSSNKVAQKHECPFCLRTFASGQALGGHKRSHMIGTNNNNHGQITLIERSNSKIRDFLDLNLPPSHTEEDTATIASSSNSHDDLIKPYWWVEHPKHEPSLSLIPY